ncbi:DUF3558 family protein [Nocardia camponoti]|uniref:DUF3558 domain-containing protein n=1 Tax=Nocardia camponoti TaxID=1616106 RepID=A0A917V8P6_9NOCA|nr:DUF3558 family protein [Nocardia camponoti]GGK50826.1 hypothetical protein GCM10011591_22980 [Nocardia camponoti]
MALKLIGTCKKTMVPILVGAILTTIVTACGSDDRTDIGSPSTPAAAEADRLPDPCAMTEADLAAAGFVSTDRITGPVGIEFKEWKGCTWQTTAGWFNVAVFTGPVNTTEFGNDAKYEGYWAKGRVSVDGVEGVGYRDKLDPSNRLRCYVGVDRTYGMVLFRAAIPYIPQGQQPPGDVCAEVNRISATLLKSMS